MGSEDIESKRAALLAKAEKCEAKAARLLSEAKEARRELKQLTQKKKTKAAADSSSDDDTTSDDDSSSSSSSDSDSSEAEVGNSLHAKSAKGVVTAAVPSDEVDLKKRGKKKSEATVPETKPKKEKKADKQEKENKEDKKSKKKDKKKTTQEEESEEETSKKSSKPEKKRKRKESKDNNDGADSDAEATHKSKKSAKTDSVSEAWNVGALDGGAARQSKFMRLLGAKKGGAATSGQGASKGSDSTRAEAEIQRQFEEGMKHKFEGGGQRRGLGA